MIPQEFWHSSFWQAFRSLAIIQVFGKLYWAGLEIRHQLLSAIYRPYVSLIAKRKVVRPNPYDFGEVYVSLTTYPERINECYYAICSLLAQKTQVNKIILTLTNEEFPAGEKDIPQRVLKLKEQGLEILWAEENLKPHNKYYYVMQKYPQATIITVDDDIIYSNKTVAKLLNSYKRNPSSIIALCTDLFTIKNDSINPYSKSMHCYDTIINIPRFDLCANGFAGVLYPPSILPKETFNAEQIKKCAPIADDIWLKYMELFGNVPVVCAGRYVDPIVISSVQESALLKKNNIQNMNDVQQENIHKSYKSIDFVKRLKGLQ